MPTAFTPRERAHISRALKDAGRRLFATVGLRKTSLADLVAETGIVKSTFYTFFDSKEALFMELLLEQAETIRRRTIDEGLLAGADTRDGLRRYLLAVVDVLDRDPLYRRLLTHPQEMDLLRRKLTDETLAQAGDNGMRELAEYVAAGQRAGRIVGDDPNVVVGALRAVLLVAVHAEEFGPNYPRVLRTSIDAVAAGLTAPPGNP